MNLAILCTDPGHPVVPRLRRWQEEMAALGHGAALCFDKRELAGGDMLFLVSCSQIIGAAEREKFPTILVLHASDLPQGRGWSPQVWSVLNGEREITVCVLEAADPVDSGPVWIRSRLRLEGHELLPEINDKLFTAELALMTRVVENHRALAPTPQRGEPGPKLRRRTPADSRLDANKSIADQFDLLRIVDNDRYPAFFDHRGKRYLIRIEKAADEP
jgi:methionyl-tRNA formyltransferase